MTNDEFPQDREAATQPIPSEPFTPASGGRQPSFVRRHSVGSIIVGAALAVVLVSGGTAWAVAASVSGNQSSSASLSVPTAAAGGGSHHGTKSKSGTNAKSRAAHRLARGTITSISPASWTIKTPAGATVTVAITTTTKFGRPNAPATASSFAIGNTIAVAGHRTGDKITARRVVARESDGGTKSTDPATSDVITN